MRPCGDCVVQLLADENATTNPIPVPQSLIQSNSAAAAAAAAASGSAVDDFAAAAVLALVIAVVATDVADVVVAVDEDRNTFCGNLCRQR